MSLLELRNKIDKALAEFGGDTQVEVRNAAGNLDHAQSVLIMSPRLMNCVVIDTSEDLYEMGHAKKIL